MSKTVVITQSNYVPWRGYFDLIRQADEVILLDTVQFTKRDWRNRNLIKTPGGARWLTIPVEVAGKYDQPIDEVRVANTTWTQSHTRTLDLNYRKAQGFGEQGAWLFEQLSECARFALLTEVNEYLLRAVCQRLGIDTPLRRCEEVLERDALRKMNATDRLVSLCRAVGANIYHSGPAAKAYLDCDRFEEHGIEVSWMNYEGYREYPQCWGTYEPHVSIVDLLLNCGTGAAEYLDR